MTGISDAFQRPINYLRISVTDRCNLRCIYCMPSEGIPLVEHQRILSYEEIRTVVQAAAELGIGNIRLTGGEPLVRPGLVQLVAMLREVPGLKEIALTTNGVLLGKYAAELKQAGLRRVNVSLDTLKPERFREITRLGELERVLAGIGMAKEVGLEPVKINVVLMRGVNDDELLDFARITLERDWHVRFIELMPFGGEEQTLCGTTGRMADGFMPVGEMRERLARLGALEPTDLAVGNGPAKYYRLPGAVGTIGFISPVSEHFCFGCNRLRLTAEGGLRPCLLSNYEVDLHHPLRNGATREDIKDVIRQVVADKPERHYLWKGVLPVGRPMSQIGG